MSKEFKPLSDKVGFCLHSRIWIGIYPNRPPTCPNNEECESCAYYEERKPTKYLQRKWKMIWKWFA